MQGSVFGGAEHSYWEQLAEVDRCVDRLHADPRLVKAVMARPAGLEPLSVLAGPHPRSRASLAGSRRAAAGARPSACPSGRRVRAPDARPALARANVARA